MNAPVIVWFRDDLRLADHAALHAALETGHPILPLYVLDDTRPRSCGGADAAPFFRIFNPVPQGRTFDPEGVYVRRFVPELRDMPARHIHAPWEAGGPASPGRRNTPTAWACWIGNTGRGRRSATLWGDCASQGHAL